MPGGCRELDSGALEEQLMLLTVQPSLQTTTSRQFLKCTMRTLIPPTGVAINGSVSIQFLLLTHWLYVLRSPSMEIRGNGRGKRSRVSQDTTVPEKT